MSLVPVLTTALPRGPTPDESVAGVKQLAFGLPDIAVFNLDEGIEAVRDALRRTFHAIRRLATWSVANNLSRQSR